MSADAEYCFPCTICHRPIPLSLLSAEEGTICPYCRIAAQTERVVERFRSALETASRELAAQQDAWDEMGEHAATEGRKDACLQHGTAAYAARQRIQALLAEEPDGKGG